MMAETLEKLKLNRKSLRMAVAKLVNNTLDATVKENPTDFDSVNELLKSMKNQIKFTI